MYRLAAEQHHCRVSEPLLLDRGTLHSSTMPLRHAGGSLELLFRPPVDLNSPERANKQFKLFSKRRRVSIIRRSWKRHALAGVVTWCVVQFNSSFRQMCLGIHTYTFYLLHLYYCSVLVRKFKQSVSCMCC